jgi:TPP-dependent pyruvate/acetoin dehydrogenase alpha subunit
MHSDAHEGLAIPASYKTPAVLLIYTVKFGKSLGSDRGKITSA